MARFLITAHSAEFNIADGFWTMGYNPFGHKLFQARFEAASTSEVAGELERVAGVVKERHPGQSFFISATLSPGDRAPYGFKDLLPLEYNAEVDPAVAEMAAERKLQPERFNAAPDPVIEAACYRFVGVGETLELDPDNLFAALEVRGFPHKGFSKSRELRFELQGRPEFTGLLGPMFDGFNGDGLPRVRYESPAAHRLLLDWEVKRLLMDD